VAKYKVMTVGPYAGRMTMAEAAKEVIKADVEFIAVTCNTEDELITGAKDADILVFAGAQITRKVLESLPKLQAVIFSSVGYDSVDTDAATDNGVIVVNNPAFQWCVEEVSNQAIVLLLACAKKLVFLNNGTKQGRWAECKRAQAPMVSIHGQTLGIIGCGSIGRMTARKITLVSLPELLKESDFISVNCLLNKETRHLMGEKEFKQMKPTAYFINTARGAVVDEPALIKALQEKWIAGAGLDVFEKEPIDSDNPLLKMDNVVVMPHSASYSDKAFSLPAKIVLQEAARVLSGQWPKNVVNKAVKPKVNLVKGN